MVRRRHPVLAETWIHNIAHGDAPCFLAVRSCQQELADAGLEMPSCVRFTSSRQRGPIRPRWQQKATRQTEHKFLRDEVWPWLDDSRRALFRSQHGPLASVPFIALPTTRATRIDPQPFRILLCRRLHLPLPLTLRSCRCGRQLDSFGHHRAACAEAGGFGTPWISSGGGRSSDLQGGWSSSVHNVFLTDLDLAAFNVLDGRRLEVVADGLTLFRGAQLAIDATMVSPLHRDGSARRRAAAVDGAALEAARRRKERTYPELAGDGGRARLVVLAAEVGGRWSTQTAQFRPGHFPCLCWTSARFHRCEIPSAHEVWRDDPFT